jgi:hypothetical protein
MVFFHKPAIGFGGDMKAGRHGQAGRHHARQRCALAANPLQRRIRAVERESEWTG